MIKTSAKPNPADQVEHWPIEKLIPFARNSRTHSAEQVAQLAASIREWGFTNPVLIDDTGGILAGHGRVMAARQLGLTNLPVVVATGWTDAQKRAYVIADNKLALNAGWDNDLLALEIMELKETEFNLPLLGFDDINLEDLGVNERIPSVENKNDQEYSPVFCVSINCEDEADQESVYKLMTGKGYKCRILSM